MTATALYAINPLVRAARAILPCRMVQTHFVGPTDHRWSRVIARNVGSGRRATWSWDHSLGPLENHFAAAAELVDDGWRIASYSGVDGGGYIFACEVID